MRVRARLAVGITLASSLWLDPARAQSAPEVPTPSAAAAVGDRVAVRFVAPEIGGPARPAFITARELALFTRLEALGEQITLESTEYPERYVRTAVDRMMARTILSNLLVQRGIEPTDLPKLVADARGELADRVGERALGEALKREGIAEEELQAFLRDQVRAAWYIDRSVTPILSVNEESLREAFRAVVHPFRGSKFEDVRPRMKRWLVVERLRAAELEFLQSARARVRVTAVAFPLPSSSPDRPR